MDKWFIALGDVNYETSDTTEHQYTAQTYRNGRIWAKHADCIYLVIL